MAELLSKDGELNSGMIIRRVLFLLLLLGLGVYHLFFNFRGLTHERGIDQAQIAREIAATNSFNTKFLRPLSVYQVNKLHESEGKGVPPTAFPDVFHAPLNPLLNSIALRFFEDDWTFDAAESGSSVYILDRVIASVAVLLFLASIFITYLLVSRIFDTKIAGVTCLMLLFCSLMWDFTQTGLPQMLMLFLFTFGLYFLFKAIESQTEEQPPYVWVALTAGFFGLLALSHWLAIWLFFGLLLFSALYFRPRGVMSILLLLVFGAIASAWAYRNFKASGDILGSGVFSLQSGLGGADASTIFRDYTDRGEIVTEGLFTKVIVNSLTQIEDLYRYLGSIVVAPLFFLSLLHPFKRKEIASFRWCILSMWIFGVIGMTLYGLPQGQIDPNQLHILSPIMAAYGLAFLTVIWNRIGFETNYPLVTQGHLIIVSIISAIPLLLPLPKNLRNGIMASDAERFVWPYFPPHINLFHEWTDDDEIIISDVPWAVAWYANRTSLWLPKDMSQYEALNTYVQGHENSFAGIYLSPHIVDSRLISDIGDGQYKDWSYLIMAGEGRMMTPPVDLLPVGFPFPEYMAFHRFSYFYSDRPRWARR